MGPIELAAHREHRDRQRRLYARHKAVLQAAPAVEAPEPPAAPMLRLSPAPVYELELERLIRQAESFLEQANHLLTRMDVEPMRSDRAKPLRMRYVLAAVVDFYKVPSSDLVSPRRPRALARVRQIACYLMKILTKASYPQIGALLGGRNHATVFHAVRKIEAARKTDAALNDELQLIIMRLAEHFEVPPEALSA